MKNKDKYVLACAEFMGLLEYGDDITSSDNHILLNDNSLVIESSRYDPTSGQQLNDAIDKARISVVAIKNKIKWRASRYSEECHGYDNDRDTAAIKCLCSLLGVEYE